MPNAIVTLDMRGYSDLSEDGKRAVFTQVFGDIREKLPNEGLVDINTWGDAVVAVFDETEQAATFALAIRTLFDSSSWGKDLVALKVRIAIHVADVKKGTDPLRILAEARKHVYGGGMVLSARIEPIVPPNHIWFTWSAHDQIQTAIKEGRLKARIHKIGNRMVPREGTKELYWLGRPEERMPENFPLKLETAISLARLGSLRRINDRIDRFHAFAQDCSSVSELEARFQEAHGQSLLALLARGPGINADILHYRAATKTFQFDPLFPPTDAHYMNWVPPMLMRTKKRRFEKPKQNDGVAPFCLWAAYAARDGVAYMFDAHETEDITHYVRKADIGEYEGVVERNVYKQSPRRGSTPYRSFLSAVVLRTMSATGTVADHSGYDTVPVGVLNISSNLNDAFSIEDCPWVDTAASLLGSLYESYYRRREFLKAQTTR